MKSKKSPFKLDPVTAGLVIGGVKSLFEIGTGFSKRAQAKQDLERSQAAYDAQRQAYEDFDFNIQNPYEDIDLSTKAQELAQEQQSQNLANTLQTLKASAGASGGAALATSIARASAASGQKAQAMTEQREMMLQQRSAQAQMAIDEQQRRLELTRLSNLMQSDLNAMLASQQGLNQANQMILGGVGNLVATGLEAGMEEGLFDKKETGPYIEEVQGITPPDVETPMEKFLRENRAEINFGGRTPSVESGDISTQIIP